MSAKLELNRFELLWFVEGFVGGSHLRWDGYETMVDKVYPQLNDDERECIYTYAKRDLACRMAYDMKENTTAYQYWCQFLARYNPANPRLYASVRLRSLLVRLQRLTIECYVRDGDDNSRYGGCVGKPSWTDEGSR